MTARGISSPSSEGITLVGGDILLFRFPARRGNCFENESRGMWFCSTSCPSGPFSTSATWCLARSLGRATGAWCGRGCRSGRRVLLAAFLLGPHLEGVVQGLACVPDRRPAIEEAAAF